MTSLLDGLRVLDLGVGPAATTTATLLTDLGADVVAVVGADSRTGPVDLDRLVGDRGQRLGLGTDAARLLEHCHVVIADAAVPAAAGSQVVLHVPPHTEHTAAPWAGGAESPELLAALSGLAANQPSHSGGSCRRRLSLPAHRARGVGCDLRAGRAGGAVPVRRGSGSRSVGCTRRTSSAASSTGARSPNRTPPGLIVRDRVDVGVGQQDRRVVAAQLQR